MTPDTRRRAAQNVALFLFTGIAVIAAEFILGTLQAVLP